MRLKPVSGSPIIVAILFVACAAIAGGIYLRFALSSAVVASQLDREARTESNALLRAQLDEETGMRGYAASGNPTFLEPYQNGVQMFAAAETRLRPQLLRLGLPDALSQADSAAQLNAEWHASVARPILRDYRHQNARELLGKHIVDRFRTTIAALDVALNRRDDTIFAALQRLVALIGLVLAVVVAVVIATVAVYSRREHRLAADLERSERDGRDREEEALRFRAAYEAEKKIADTLQMGFTQRPLPSLPSLRFSAMYVPAAEESKVGGDWYDVLELPNHRILFAIGDVAGHGIDAAVGMNRARQALLISALRSQTPDELLARVNNEFVRGPLEMVTTLVGFADVDTFELSYASAGHPPPVLVEPRRQPVLLPVGGPPLGVVPGARYRTHTIQATPGAMLLLYTDGAIEHTRNVLDGEARLLEVASMMRDGTPDDPARAIHRAIFAGKATSDDVAILTIGFAASPPRLVVNPVREAS